MNPKDVPRTITPREGTIKRTLQRLDALTIELADSPQDMIAAAKLLDQLHGILVDRLNAVRSEDATP